MIGDNRVAGESANICRKRHRPSKATVEKDNSQHPVNPPSRDCNKLFCQVSTIQCCLLHSCIPCAYKVGLFDVALDTEFCRLVPNQRPEACVRLKRQQHLSKEESSTSSMMLDGTLGYHRGMSVLTIGDGDFSFTLAIARLFFGGIHMQKNEESSLIGTSYEAQTVLRKIYPSFDQNVNELTNLGVQLQYNVDATNIRSTSTVDTLFHRIVWNFPCTAIERGQDGQNQAMEENKQLIRKFVKNATELLIPDVGEIHMCHKTKPPFNQWKMEDVVMEADSRLYYHGRIVLDRAIIPPYTPRKALDKKSFPCHDACTYVFSLRPLGDEPDSKTAPPQGKLGNKYRGTIPSDCHSKSPSVDKMEHGPTSLVPLNDSLLHGIRKQLLSKVGHVSYHTKGKRSRRNKRRRQT